MEDELRAEYDLKSLKVRKLGLGRKNGGTIIRLEPDVAEKFPDANAVNEALRFLIRVIQQNQPSVSITQTASLLEQAEENL